MVLTNNTLNTRPITETTVTTRTQEVGTALPQQNILQKNPITTTIQEQPVLQSVIEKRNLEVHHKPIVQEIHEQKIIEIEKQPLMQTVVQQPILQQTRAETRYEEIGTNFNEQERLRLTQLNAPVQPVITQQQGAVRQIKENEVVSQVVRQELIEHHIQPVITEVREQKVIQSIEQPIVRKVYEQPIIREVVTQVQQPMLQQQGFIQQQNLSGIQQPLLHQQQGFQQPLLNQHQGLLAGGVGATQLHHQGGLSGIAQNLTHSNILPNNGIAQQPLLTQQQGLQQPLNSGLGQQSLIQTVKQEIGLGQRGIQQPLLNQQPLLQQQQGFQQPLNSGLQSGLIQQPLTSGIQPGLQQGGMQGIVQTVKQEITGTKTTQLAPGSVQQPLLNQQGFINRQL